jgi:FAD/FMN-containing dehydrogenase
MSAPESDNNVIGQLQQALGTEYVLLDEADRSFYAMDVYRQREVPMAVVQPATQDELRLVARIAHAGGIALVPRGGGASYTDGYLPATDRSITVDTSRMNRIIEINAEDMYITVEPGVTWAQMAESLAEQDLRTPFWGPFSGLKATVGGSMSQNSASMGTGNFGISADSVLCFEIIRPGGEILRTGSHAAANGTPFYRWYGPDLTGLFTGDAGSLGIKASITLRLMRKPTHTGTCSFGYTSFEGLRGGMCAAAREGVAADNFGLDPKLQEGQLGGVSASDAFGAAWAVLKTSPGIFSGLLQVLRMAAAGKRFIKGFSYSSHYVAEGFSRAEVASKLERIRAAIRPHGTEIANTVPTVLRAMPFIPLYPILGQKGERWVPMHGIIAFSRVQAFRDGLMALYEEYRERMETHKVAYGAMFLTVSTHAFLYEPVFYWEDSRTQFHKRYMPQDYIATLPEYPENPEGRALVAEMRERIQGLFVEVGATHYQAGKSYPYMEGRDAEAARLIRSIKSAVDPDGLMNPGALQLP